MAISPEEVPEQHHHHLVDITVNRKPVKVTAPKDTGLQIKQAAIDQGVAIELSFQLSEELAHREKRIIGDAELVAVRDDSKFIAVAGDDNS